ncbi:hypothetical protein ABZ471_03275 [Streptomyces sp. NPDC005728]|uniref:hypothetical protein n=1 Tax=Streptomyces sp. NPDC005728 TaxID=3157054 RepID=UPI0034008512
MSLRTENLTTPNSPADASAAAPEGISPRFHADIPAAPRYASVATLADDPAGLTCSVTVGLRWGASSGKAGRLLGYPSFEEAAESVKDGRHDALLVAGAYPEIRTFFFDAGLSAVESFISPLPDMVFAAPEHNAALERFDTVHYHPATRVLFETHVQGRTNDAVQATSNSAACRDALENPGQAAAITNRTCADHYGLTTLKVLSRGTPMSFVVFEPKNRRNQQS